MGDDLASHVEELTSASCWTLLREAPIGRIALSGDDGIEVFPVNYVVDGGSVVFRSGIGTKLRLIADGSPCTFQVDEIDVVHQLVWSVVAKGVVRPIAGHDAITATFDMEVPTWQRGPKPTYLRVTPTALTGRRFPVTTS